MKVTIVDNSKNKTPWYMIEAGVVFSTDNIRDYYIKINEICDGEDQPFNAVNLSTGEPVRFMTDYVKVIDAELVVKER